MARPHLYTFGGGHSPMRTGPIAVKLVCMSLFLAQTSAALDISAPALEVSPGPAGLALSAVANVAAGLASNQAFASFYQDSSEARQAIFKLPSQKQPRAFFQAAGILSQDALQAEAAAGAPQPAIDEALAALNNEVGRHKDAMAFARQAAQGRPKDPAAWIGVAQAAVGLNQGGQALLAAKKSVALGARNPDAWKSAAEAYNLLGQKSQALRSAKRALALNPSDSSLRALVDALLQKPLSLHPVRVAVNWDKRASGGTESDAGAIATRRQETLGRARLQRSSFLGVRSLLSDAADKIKIADYSSALSDAAKAIAREPQNAAGYYYLAAARNMNGQYQAAVEGATEGLAVNPAYVLLRDERAWAFEHLGRVRDAMADADSALELDPKDSYAYANLSQADAREGDARNALRNLARATALNPQFTVEYRKFLKNAGFTEPSARSDSLALTQARRDKAFGLIILGSCIGGLFLALGILGLLKPQPIPSDLAAAPKDEGIVIAGLAVLRKIPHAGLGEAYEAWDSALERPVSVKIFRTSSGLSRNAKSGFMADLRALAALKHPALLDIYSTVEDQNGFSLVFEAVDRGRTLKDLASARDGLAPAKARAIAIDLADALEYALFRGVSYPYLKPADILMLDGGRLKILEFGVPAARMLRAGEAKSPGAVMEQAAAASLADCLNFMVGKSVFDSASGQAPQTVGQFLRALDGFPSRSKVPFAA
ncbi:MAG: protein kinase domain-containing protein [Elusimicrobiota bacterium]